jgi:hypothetical protein
MQRIKLSLRGQLQNTSSNVVANTSALVLHKMARRQRLRIATIPVKGETPNIDTFNAFAFSTVPNILCELGAIKRLGALVKHHFPNARHALIVTDAGFLKTGLVDAPVSALKAENLSVRIYSDVLADPPEAIVLQAAKDARDHDIDLVIGLGGGSSMDVAKLIAVLSASDQPSIRCMASVMSKGGDCH